MRTMYTLTCETCGASFQREKGQVREHHFCSRACARVFTSARMRRYNETENPMNTSAGWSQEDRARAAERSRLMAGPCAAGTYIKHHGRHLHRVVAEEKLGRPLIQGEVVHHIDGNKHNNSPENLMVITQAEHAKIHAKERRDAKCRL